MEIDNDDFVHAGGGEDLRDKKTADGVARINDSVFFIYGKIVSFTYDNNASTVSFELNGKQVVLTSKEKVSDMPTPNGRTYSNDELTYNNKNGIKITDKKGKLIFEEKQ